jgi:glycosyltransferase involved in cell wall biosynthesis
MANKVVLFFRKKRPSANFSIERSFAATQDAFDQIDFPKPLWHTLHHFSQGVLPRLLSVWEAWRNRADVNHVTGDINFLVLGLPAKNTILTVLDCGFLRRSNPIARAVIKSFWLDLPVRHAKYITAISESTKKEIIQYTNCNPDKIRVIPVVITSDFYPVPQPFNAEHPRILHIGTAFNKNLHRHIEALAGIPCTLYIIGKIGPEIVELLERHQIKYENGFELTAEQVFEAYKQCDILLFASLVEGFGMPILEAQTIGRPVVTSNTTSMPEVAGAGACLVDPYEVQSIRAGILKVIKDAVYRTSLIDNGLVNVKRYQALQVTKQYAELYQEVLSASSNKH